MRGIRKLQKCPAEDLVWGTVPHHKPDFGVAKKCYDGIAKVRVKVTPYAADFADISRGTAPDPWYTGDIIPVPWSIQTTGELMTSGEGDSTRLCGGTRCVYIDGKQRFVNLWYHQGIGENSHVALVSWHQWDIEQEIMSSTPFFG